MTVTMSVLYKSYFCKSLISLVTTGETYDNGRKSRVTLTMKESVGKRLWESFRHQEVIV